MKKCLLFLLALLLVHCSKDDFNATVRAESKIVVEGWIEEGDFAQVLLSSSIPVAEVIDSTNVLNHVIRSAKITVSDGTLLFTIKKKSFGIKNRSFLFHPIYTPYNFVARPHFLAKLFNL